MLTYQCDNIQNGPKSKQSGPNKHIIRWQGWVPNKPNGETGHKYRNRQSYQEGATQGARQDKQTETNKN